MRESRRERRRDEPPPATNWLAFALMFLGGLLFGALLTGGAVGAWAIFQMRASRAEMEMVRVQAEATRTKDQAEIAGFRQRETDMRTQAERERLKLEAFMNAQRSAGGLDQGLLEQLRKLQEEFKQIEKMSEPPGTQPPPRLPQQPRRNP